MFAVDTTNRRVRRPIMQQCAAVFFAAIAVFALGTGPRAVADEALVPEKPGQTGDQIESQFAETIETFNELMKKRRFEEAVIVAKQAQLLQRENPMCEAMVSHATRAAQARMRQLDARLAHKLATVDQLCELTAEQKQRLRLAGRGDIKRFCDRADSNLDSLFERGSIFAKVLKTTLTAEQMAAYNEAPPMSVNGSVVRWVDPIGKTVWIGLGESDGLQPRTIYAVRKKLRVEGDPDKPQDEPGDERIKGTIEVFRVLDKNLSEARIVESAVDDPIAKGDLIIPKRQNAR